MDNSSPTNSGPDSEVASTVSELPQDAKKNLEPGYIPEDLTNKVAAATSYVGSFFNPSSWKNPSEKSPDGSEAEPADRKNSTNGGSSGISNSIFSAIGKVQELTKVSPVSPSEETAKDENPELVDSEKEKTEEQTGVASGGFFSAFSKMGISGMKSSNTTENISDAAGDGSPKDDCEESEDKRKETWGNSLSNAFNKVGKAATDYSKGNLLFMSTWKHIFA